MANLQASTRRNVLATAAILAPLALAACSGEADPDPKPSASATLLNFDKVKEALESLSSAVDDLETAANTFDTEDWKDVVPRVKAATSAVSDSLTNLKEAVAGVSAE